MEKKERKEKIEERVEWLRLSDQSVHQQFVQRDYDPTSFSFPPSLSFFLFFSLFLLLAFSISFSLFS